MTASFVVVRLPPERNSSDLILHLVRTEFQFTVASKVEDVARFMEMGQDAAGPSTFSQLSLSAETPSSSFIQQNHSKNENPLLQKNTFDPSRKEVKQEIQDGDYGIDKSQQQHAPVPVEDSGKGLGGESIAQTKGGKTAADCPECEKKAMRLYRLGPHLKSRHGYEEDDVRLFKLQLAMKQKMKNFPGPLRSFDQCQNVFVTKNGLNRHRRAQHEVIAVALSTVASPSDVPKSDAEAKVSKTTDPQQPQKLPILEAKQQEFSTVPSPPNPSPDPISMKEKSVATDKALTKAPKKYIVRTEENGAKACFPVKTVAQKRKDENTPEEDAQTQVKIARSVHNVRGIQSTRQSPTVPISAPSPRQIWVPLNGPHRIARSVHSPPTPTCYSNSDLSVNSLVDLRDSLPRGYMRGPPTVPDPRSKSTIIFSANSQMLSQNKAAESYPGGERSLTGNGNISLPRGSLKPDSSITSESQTSVASTYGISAASLLGEENLPSSQPQWPINRLVEFLSKGPFFAFNFIKPLPQEYAPLLLANFSHPRGTFPMTHFRQGSLFFFATIRMDQQPWLYLCPHAISKEFRFQRFVYYKKAGPDQLVHALFQYIVETVNPNSPENTQVLRCKTVEVGPLTAATLMAIKNTGVNAKTPPTQKSYLAQKENNASEDVDSHHFPTLRLSPTSPTATFESDILLDSIVSSILSKGFFFASSFLTPLVMRAIPSILKQKEVLLGNQSPFDFTKNGSFFRVSIPGRFPGRDGYSPWINKEMIRRIISGATVTRSCFTHPCNDKFKRYMFTIESVKGLVLYQYVLDGPIPPVKWMGGRKGHDQYMKEKVIECIDAPALPKSREENILAAPRSTATRKVKLPKKFPCEEA